MANHRVIAYPARRAVLVTAALVFMTLGGCDDAPGPSPVCVITLSPGTSSYEADGGTGRVTVASSAESCGWVAATSASWISLQGQPFGTGSGSFDYRVAASTSPQQRTAAIAVGTQSHVVVQAGQPLPPCAYTLQPGATAIAANGGDGSFAVQARSDCVWTASTSTDWIVVTAGMTGSGDGTVSFRATPNTATSSRTGTITVADQVFTITQSGESVACNYSVSPVQLSTCMPAGSALFRVTTTSGCTWTVNTGVPWLDVTTGSSGSGTQDVSVAFTANYDAPREGVVEVRWPSPTQGQNVRLAQAGCIYSVIPAVLTAPAAGVTANFDVLQQSDPTACGGPEQDACIWTAQSDVPWITVTTPMPQRGDRPVSITIAPNAGPARTGTVRVRSAVVTITQSGV